jgi:glycosyltransferase involved in cell wall biosynthesis
MKVLVFTNLYPNKSTLPDKSLIFGLFARGVSITVITRIKTSETAELEASGIKLIYHQINKKVDLKAICRIRSLIRDEKFDILHFTYGKALTNGLIASVGYPVKIVAYLGSLRLHWHDPSSYLSYLNSRVDKLICVSDAVKDHVLGQTPRRMKNKAVRIYKGADPDWFRDVIPANRKDIGIPEDAFVICCVANVRKIKGLDWLIGAVAFLPSKLPVWFLLVGEKTDSAELSKKIERTGYGNRFIRIGYSEDPTIYTSMCDLYIQPSLSEGFGKAILEAMCLGKPVIVTEKGGARELVKEGINGFIVPVRSSKAIADKILFCYKNRGMLHQIGENGRETIKKDFNHRDTVENTYNLYRELAE